jgi:diadenosine tetraphosphate (Ap4A) HIT family hydrolase
MVVLTAGISAGRALLATFRPWKMNYSCFGNAEPHVHWHLMPRYVFDADRRKQPWLHVTEFKDHLIGETEARALAESIRAHIVKKPTRKDRGKATGRKT